MGVREQKLPEPRRGAFLLDSAWDGGQRKGHRLDMTAELSITLRNVIHQRVSSAWLCRASLSTETPVPRVAPLACKLTSSPAETAGQVISCSKRQDRHRWVLREVGLICNPRRGREKTIGPQVTEAGDYLITPDLRLKSPS